MASKHTSIDKITERQIPFDVCGPLSAGCVDHLKAIDKCIVNV